MKRVGCLCRRKVARKASGVQLRCHVLSSREGSACIWESVGGVGKCRPKMVWSGSARQALKHWELCGPRDCSLRVKDISQSIWEGHKRMRWTVITRCAGTEGAWALPSEFEYTVCMIWSRVRGSRVQGRPMFWGADCRALAAGYGLEPSNCGTAGAGAKRLQNCATTFRQSASKIVRQLVQKCLIWGKLEYGAQEKQDDYFGSRESLAEAQHLVVNETILRDRERKRKVYYKTATNSGKRRWW